jgi:hypothetical protein
MTSIAIVRNKALDLRQAERKALPLQRVDRLSVYEQNDTDDGRQLTEDPGRGTPNV